MKTLATQRKTDLEFEVHQKRVDTFWGEFLHQREQLKNVNISTQTYIKLLEWSVMSVIKCETTNTSETNKKCVFFQSQDEIPRLHIS